MYSREPAASIFEISVLLRQRYISSKLHTLIRKKWLQFEMYRWYGRKNTLSRLLILIQMKLTIRLRDFELLQILREPYQLCSSHHRMLRITKERKLTKLRRNTQQSNKSSYQPPAFYPRLVNLTNVTFDNNESELLEKGLKFALPPPKLTQVLDTLVANLLVGLASNPAASSNQCAEIVKSELQKGNLNVPAPPTSIVKSIWQKMKSHDLCMIKADKGNGFVIMTPPNYDAKVTEFLTNNNANQVTFNFNKFNAVVRRRISESQYIIPQRSKTFLKISNTRLPRLYGLPKLHKPNCPMRSIVSFISSPTYNHVNTSTDGSELTPIFDPTTLSETLSN